jgi:hypothetical protein
MASGFEHSMTPSLLEEVPRPEKQTIFVLAALPPGQDEISNEYQRRR